MSKNEIENEVIEATLNRIIFQNTDTGFIIGAFVDSQGNKLSALGNMINPQVNMDYILTGDYEHNQKFGEQFKFVFYETVLPIDPSGIFRYITRICKWVGSSVGNAMVDKYGDQTLITMKTDPERIATEIHGITLTRAKEIQATLLENEKTEKVMVELESMLDIPGMLKRLPSELIKRFKSQAAEFVKVNPYILTEFNGVGFPLADMVALKNGYARDGIERKKAVCLHCIKENMQAGSVWISEANLMENMTALVQVYDLEDGIFFTDGEGCCYEG
jgi:exodeoxyribonuclease V alpha subunit